MAPAAKHLAVLFLAGIFGIIGALIYKARTGRAETPFAPALCIALWLCVIYGNHIAAFMNLS